MRSEGLDPGSTRPRPWIHRIRGFQDLDPLDPRSPTSGSTGSEVPKTQDPWILGLELPIPRVPTLVIGKCSGLDPRIPWIQGLRPSNPLVQTLFERGIDSIQWLRPCFNVKQTPQPWNPGPQPWNPRIQTLRSRDLTGRDPGIQGSRP